MRAALERAADGLPKLLRWRPVVPWRGLVVGSLLTVGGNVLLQQLGATTLTTASLLLSLLLGCLLGIVAPSIGRLVGVLWANAILRKARRRLEAP
jgi:hypothetical protein